MRSLTRRSILKSAPLALPLVASAAESAPAISDTYPQQLSSVVKETVGVSHGNFKRLKELVDAQPSLANANWDWGFGDWESALGAASHVGNRAIAEYLIEKGARPTLFSAAMLGQLEVVKAFVTAQPGVQRIRGPHSITLLAHAKAGGAAAEPVLKYLESLGDANGTPAPPLTEEEKKALTGSYLFGTGPTEKITVEVMNSQLMFTRQGTQGRNLIHLGEHIFHPAGASAVRIKFTADVLTIHDPNLILTAKKS